MYIRSTVSASTNSVMLIEPVPFSSSALSSSGVNWTYRPFANSYPLIMSFFCSQLNEIAADASPAENILIGTETSPKEIVAEPIECAGIGPAGDRVSVRPTASGYYHWREGGSILRLPADCHAVRFRSTMDHARDPDPPDPPDPPPTRRRAQAIPRQALR